jgi:hypothetical protein
LEAKEAADQQKPAVDMNEHLMSIKQGAAVRSHNSIMDEILAGGVTLSSVGDVSDSSGPMLEDGSYSSVTEAPMATLKTMIPHFPTMSKDLLNKVETVDKSKPVIEEGVNIRWSDPNDTRSPHLKAIASAAEKRSRRLMMQLKKELKGVFAGSGVTLERAFRAFDENGDGVIDHGEFERGLRSLGAKLSEEQLNDLIAMLDKDGDGSIDYIEFARWFGARPPPPPLQPEMVSRVEAKEAAGVDEDHLAAIRAAADRRAGAGAAAEAEAEEDDMLHPVAAVIDSLRVHHALEIQQAGTYALWRLVYKNADNRQRVAASGGIEVLQAAVERFPMVAVVQEYAFAALARSGPPVHASLHAPLHVAPLRDYQISNCVS